MFRAKRTKPAPAAKDDPAPIPASAYQRVELPTFHGRTRKVIVYTSDASGRIIKTVKKG